MAYLKHFISYLLSLKVGTKIWGAHVKITLDLAIQNDALRRGQIRVNASLLVFD